MDVFNQIRQKYGNVKLLLVGDGEERGRIEHKIAAENLQEEVVLTGAKENTWDYYSAMDVFVMPSVYEGVPVVSVEAQMSGLPCCFSLGVSREAAITELVQFRSLEDSAEKWAEWILSRISSSRENMSEEIRQAGYDIADTAHWLQNYYIKMVK